MKIIFAFDFVTPIFDHSNIIPLGILSLATILKADGNDVEVLDLNVIAQENFAQCRGDGRYAHLARYLAEKEPAVIGFTTMCGSFHNVLLLARHIKRVNGNIKIMLGGPQASSMPEEVLRVFAWIDLIVTGEAENSIRAIIDGLEHHRLRDVSGIAYREKGRIRVNPPAELVADLDTLPFLDHRLVGGETWRATMEVSRGCPCRCVFCNTARFWQHKFRVKSIGRVEREILAIKKRANQEQIHISFVDDNFTSDYDFTLRLCAKLRELGIKWNCDARVDTLDETLIAAMAEAGCESILLGIESGSPRVQRQIGKNLDLTKVNAVIDLLLRYQVKQIVSFMYGFPEETAEDVNLTLNLLYGMVQKGVTKCVLHSLCVLAGTQLFDQCADQLILKDFYSDMTDAADFEAGRELIRGNPALFSHFYTLKGSVADRYPLLDRFINYILVRLYPYFPRSLDALIHYFEGNMLLFYDDFVANAAGFADFFRDREQIGLAIKNLCLNKRMISFLTTYISAKCLADFNFRVINHQLAGEKDNLQRNVRRLNL